MNLVLAVALGGAMGAVSRHFTSGFVMRLLGLSFPFGTLTVNVLGSFIMGFLVEVMALKFDVSPALRGFMTVGFLGGFTTFSTFSLETALLIERGTYALAAIYVIASVTVSVVALFFGLFLGRVVVA